uniref:Uncharacterized protein n=1 Tax=Siphoviridae sp. ctaDn21 TaxID=2825563 RepID=A0A8S5UVB1_9CAUD|nr:MAG TPA: hypothetical protein [Siphoviridae sp. ctaDn21]
MFESSKIKVQKFENLRDKKFGKFRPKLRKS